MVRLQDSLPRRSGDVEVARAFGTSAQKGGGSLEKGTGAQEDRGTGRQCSGRQGHKGPVHKEPVHKEIVHRQAGRGVALAAASNATAAAPIQSSGRSPSMTDGDCAVQKSPF